MPDVDRRPLLPLHLRAQRLHLLRDGVLHAPLAEAEVLQRRGHVPPLLAPVGPVAEGHPAHHSLAAAVHRAAELSGSLEGKQEKIFLKG